MRIRKHAKISQLLSAASPPQDGAVLQTYVCQLNQSPWDAMSFSPFPSPPRPPPPPPPQVDAADANSAGGGNGGSDRRVLVAESNNLLNGNGNVNEFLGGATAAVDKEQCCKTDGKSWRCRREAEPGSSLCDHHLSLVKNYQNLAHNTRLKSKKSVENRRSNTRSRWRIESPPLASSHEFYYYSGFRPGWSKKRSQPSNNNNVAGSDSKSEMGRPVAGASCSGVQINEGVINSEEEYNEDDEDKYEEYQDEGAFAGKMRRVRKTVKSRSLKSLM